jgi:DNA-binding NarL/FixJ family response regulator
MNIGVCLISAGRDAVGVTEALLLRCGLTVWTPASADATSDGSVYKRALCLIIDMPGRHGLRTLQLLRRYGIRTPAILVVDHKDDVTPNDILQAGVLDALPSGGDPRDLLRWVECVCMAQKFLLDERARRATPPLSKAA